MKSSALYNAQVHLKAADLAFLLTDDSRKRRNCALLAKAVKYQKENRGATNEPICVLQSSPRASLTTCEREESGPRMLHGACGSSYHSPSLCFLWRPGRFALPAPQGWVAPFYSTPAIGEIIGYPLHPAHVLSGEGVGKCARR